MAELEERRFSPGLGERDRERERVQLAARWAQIEMPGQKLGVRVCNSGDRCRLGDTAVRVGSILVGMRSLGCGGGGGGCAE